MKKKLSLILALMMLLPACAPESDDVSQDTTGVTTADTAIAAVTQTTAPAIPADKLPDTLNFDGETFCAYTRVKYFFHGEMFIDESNGEMLNDARFDARTAVESRLNVSFEEEYYGDLGNYSDNDAPRNLLLSGDTTYDIYNGRHAHMFTYAAQGLAHKLTEVPYLDLTAHWWDEEFSNDITLGKEKYFAFGAYNLTTYDSIHMLLFNKKLFTDLNIEEMRLGGQTIYDVVKAGNWTYDLMNEVMTDVSADMDGDGVMTKADRWAYVTPAKQVLPSFLIGGGFYMVQKDENNFLYNSMEGNEGFYDAFIDIMDMMWTNSTWFPTPASMTDEEELEIYDMFKNGQGLFCDSTGGNVIRYREMDIDFGIIPYPKSSDSQEYYCSRSEYPELFVIPLVNDTLDCTGAVLEALSSEYYRSVIPAYFEQSLKGRTVRDEESSEMLELIYAHRVFDFGDTVLCSEIRDGKMRELMAENNRDFSSMLTSISPIVKKRMNTLNKGFGLGS